MNVVLASGSPTRAAMLAAAGISFTVVQPRIDEETARSALQGEGARPREIADALAELKALRVSAKHPGALTIGADQVLEMEREPIGKCDTRDDATRLLARLSGRSHILWSAAVVAEDGRPVWRHIGEARLRMRSLSDVEIEAYLDRNWPDISDTVGCYKIEAEGIRLFDSIGSDYHAILGLPLLPLLSYLTARGVPGQ